MTSRRSTLGLALSLVGVVVVGYWLVVGGIAAGYPAWVYVVGGVALAAWAARELVPWRVPAVASGFVMVAAGAVVVPSTESVLVTPVIIGLVVVTADRRVPVLVGVGAAIGGSVILAVAAAVDGRTATFVLGNLAGVLLGILVGYSRRQFREAEERRLEAAEEQRRAELLADRSRAARDIHDVLAHSLGGLVLQLDAVEALIEAGRVDDALRRAVDARALAADGLAEARRAVAALRDDDAPPGRAGAAPGTDGLVDLVAAHRSFGGVADTAGDLTLARLDTTHARVAVAAAREALSNARRHAPGLVVTVTADATDTATDVVVRNPLAPDVPVPDVPVPDVPVPAGGHGLVGMRERFAELGDASTVTAGPEGGAFVVRMHLEGRP